MLDNFKDLHGDMPEDELTADQLLERLQGAKLVAESQQRAIKALTEETERLRQTIDVQTGGMQRQNAALRDMAQDLASAGSYGHKGKNEVILAVIYRLLARGNELVDAMPPVDMDDIPF